MTPFVRRLFILVIALLLVAGVAVFALRYLRGQEEAPAPAAEAPAGGGLPAAANAPAPSLGGTSATVTEPVGGSAAVPTAPAAPEASEEEKLLHALVVTSRDFAERYGSYSTQGEYANLETLLPLMTDAFRTKTEEDIAAARERPAATSYLGVTTVALSVKPAGTVSETEPATVRVLAQRTTETDGGTTVTYETLRLTLVHDGTVWKVGGAAWEKS